MSPGHVLVVGDEMRIFLAVARSLGRAGHVVHAAPFDRRSPALKSRYISAIHDLPRYETGASAWLRAVLDLVEREAITCIVPTCDRAILPLSAHRREFAGTPVLLPNEAAMDVLFDKDLTKAEAARLGIPVPAGERLGPGADADDLVRRFGLPLVIKPRRSYWLDRLSTWGKVHVCDSATEVAAVLAGIEEPERFLVEASVPGVGMGISVLARAGTILQTFQHRRLREGRGGSSSYRISEPADPEMSAACARFAKAVALDGPCMFEFRRDLKTGAFALLETNARFWGSISLPIASGVDFPRFAYDLLTADVVHPPAAYRAGIRSRNIVLDARNLLVALRSGEAGLAALGDFALQPIGWLTGRERSDSLVADDLAPALFELLDLRRAYAESRHRRKDEADRAELSASRKAGA